MQNRWRECLEKSGDTLVKSGNPAVIYFTNRDLLEKRLESPERIRNFTEPRRITGKQQPDGSWKGPAGKKAAYPENHADLVATFKAFRTLVEKYEFDRSSEVIENAAEFLLSFQTAEGDIRGFIANQYATYYTGYVLSLLIQAGYADDPRIETGMNWLLSMRQDDGGWTIPILTRYFDGKTMFRLTGSYDEPVEPDRSQPFSHNWTDMVLRAFSRHPAYRKSREVKASAVLLKSRFFKPDVYSSYRNASYWVRFVHWWPNLLTSLESLLLLGFPADDPDISNGLSWFFENQQPDGLWKQSYDGKPGAENKHDAVERAWLTLRICRMMKGFLSLKP